MLIDSHCHLNYLDISVDDALAKAKANGISAFLNVSINLETFDQVLTAAENHRAVFASVGLHPSEQGRKPSVDELVKLASHPKVVAIGETGLDYFRCDGDMSWQRERFITHITAAREAGLPLIIHTREAEEDTLAILRAHNAAQVGGVMHCFTGTKAMAEASMELGFYISFSGIVTFKNAKSLQELARELPLERILVETDSPYLAPTPFRGKPNQPAYTRYVAEKIAELRGVSLATIEQVTSENFAQCFAKTALDVAQ